MYFPDLSCNPSHTFRKIAALQISNIVPIDWMSLITITPKKIVIDGEMHYTDVDSQQVIDLLKKDTEQLLLPNTGRLYSLQQSRKNLSVMIVPIRSQDFFRVYFACATFTKEYDTNNLFIMNMIMGIMYENVLLSNAKFQEENYLANILNSTESVVISLNLQGEITTANTAALKLFQEKMVMGKHISELFEPHISDAICASVTQVGFSNSIVHFKDTLATTKSGNSHVLNIAFSPLHDSKKRVVGVVMIASDITDKRVLEKQIEQLKQFAMLGEVAAGVAHDIKNPLMSIRGCSKILRKQLSEQSDCLEFIDPIIQEVDRINEVVEQMVSYGRITEENTYTLVDINEVLEKSINVMRFHRDSKQIVIKKDLSRNIPFVRGHNVQLQQAFINILINAVQAIADEGTIKIKSEYVTGKKSIRVSITDTGKGIESKDLDNIFRPFFTTKQPTRGLGLSIVERVIQDHNGKIAITSLVNKGTTFNVILPCQSKEQ